MPGDSQPALTLALPSQFDTEDLESLPDLKDIIKGSKKAPILIDEDLEQEDIKIEPAIEGPPAAADPPAAAIEDPPAAVDPPGAGMENHWSRQDGDDDRGLRLRPKTSLRATARLRDRSQRRE